MRVRPPGAPRKRGKDQKKKKRTGYSKSEKMDPWVSKSEGKGTKNEPRDTKSDPKRQPKGAKGSQK